MSEPAINLTNSTTAKEVDRMVAAAELPVLQIGSRETVVDKGPRRWRDLFAARGVKGADFTGLDVASGDNVDVVADICADFDELDGHLAGQRYGFVICQHVLEHVKDPFKAARNLVQLLRPQGSLYIAVPWVQSYHGYPDDFWRFSFHGVLQLFPEMDFVDMYYSASGSGLDAAYKITVDGKVDLERTPYAIEGSLFQIEADRDWNLAQPAFRRNGKLPLARFYMPVIFVNALGRRKDATSTK